MSADIITYLPLPAKSAVGGGIVVIAVFAPPLDKAGNIVTVQKVVEYVARTLNYNLHSPSSVGLK